MFEFPTLLWFLPLVGLPILIHLINMLRHKRVRWAPMEFLLQSQKRNRTWVMLKQLLLLLLRIAAVAAVILMLAQPKIDNTLGALVGGAKTHHIVLLDDSFSMSDHWADTSAFKQATDVIERLGGQLSQQGGRQEFTLLLYSQASHRGGGMKAALSREPVSSDFKNVISNKLADVHPSELAVGPAEGLSAVEQMVNQNDAATIVYIISDFRAKDWAAGSDLRQSLSGLTALGAKLQLIDCVDAERPNLVISALKPGLGIRAAGVPLKIEVAVTNYGQQTAHDVSIELQEDGKSRPAITIASIPAGKTAAGDFEVRYANPGQHTIMAKLPSDAVETDNTRYSALQFPESIPVLVIAGDGQSATKKGDAYFLTLPFSSNNIAPTGIAPRIESPRFLREKPLDPFHVIYLLDVDRLDQTEIDALEKYVAAGGGVAFFMGDRSRADFYNTRLYRDGKGIFPAPLVGPTELLVDRTEIPSDLTVEGNHPVFSLFAGQPNVDIDKVVVERYFAVNKNWTPPTNSTTRVVARLRNGAPLVIEKTMGEGRVIAFLTTAAPTWNNLARTPRHIGAMLQMAAYLSAAKQTDPGREVGNPLEVEFDPAKYQSQIKFVIPARGRAENLAVEAAPAGNNLYKAVLPGDAMRSGIYEVQLTARSAGAAPPSADDKSRSPTAGTYILAGVGAAPPKADDKSSKPADDKSSAKSDDRLVESRRFAYNVVPEEGDLKIVDGPQLETQLGGVNYHFHHASEAFTDAEDSDQANLSRIVLYALIGLLVCEQLLAYSCSYHPSAKEFAR